MKRVLVTGAGGFVGRHVTAALAGAGIEVHGVTASGERSSSQCTWHQADLLDASQREHLMARVAADALIHLAWCAKPPDYWTDPHNVRWVSGTLELVRAFARYGGHRVVAAGTCAEYDWTYGYCTERRTPLAASSVYGAAKAACGNLLETYGAATGLSIAWARLFFLFGPGDSPLRLVPSMIARLGAGEPAHCRSGSHVRDFIYAGDAAAALVALLHSNVTGPVNIASGMPISIGEIVRHVADEMNACDLLTIEPGPAEHALVCANIARLRDEVGWQPCTGTLARLDETIRWWRSPRAAANNA